MTKRAEISSIIKFSLGNYNYTMLGMKLFFNLDGNFIFWTSKYPALTDNQAPNLIQQHLFRLNTIFCNVQKNRKLHYFSLNIQYTL